jgi:hypothetical protein
MACVAVGQSQEQHRLSPPGIFYLVQRVSVKTNSGVVGYAPGTRVKLIEERGDRLLVTDGESKIEVDGDKVTNDMDLAELAAKKDERSQQAIQEYFKSQQAAYRAEREKEKPSIEHMQREMEAHSSVAQTTAPKEHISPLDKGAYNEKDFGHYWDRHHPYIFYRK